MSADCDCGHRSLDHTARWWGRPCRFCDCHGVTPSPATPTEENEE